MAELDTRNVEIIGLSSVKDTQQVADIVLALQKKYQDEKWPAAKGFGLICGIVAVMTEEAAVGMAEQGLEPGETIENRRAAFEHYVTHMITGAVKNGMKAAADQIITPSKSN